MGLALQDRWPEAVEAFRQAVRLRPDFVEAHNNLGFALATLGKSPEAIKAYQQAIKIKPDYATAHYNLGFTYEAVGKLPEAVGVGQRERAWHPRRGHVDAGDLGDGVEQHAQPRVVPP